VAIEVKFVLPRPKSTPKKRHRDAHDLRSAEFCRSGPRTHRSAGGQDLSFGNKTAHEDRPAVSDRPSASSSTAGRLDGYSAARTARTKPLPAIGVGRQPDEVAGTAV
jgi:hypothetical protein